MAANNTTLEVRARDRGVLEISMARPERHNAFDATLIGELRAAFEAASDDAATRCIVLSGQGRSFSAGADIDWMRAQGAASHEANVASALDMAWMFHAIYSCRKPVVAKVHGAALGGGTGLTAAADIAIAAADATFGFTEVRLGIVPAVISPYIVEKLGTAKARALFLTGERFDGREAERVGLVFRAVPAAELDAAVESCVRHLLAGGPNALAEVKSLTRELAARRIEADIEPTAERIARLRGSDEAREGLGAFLDKRKARWQR